MQNRLTVAAVQMNSGADSQENLHKAVKLVEQAAGDGAQLVALPELFLCLTQLDKVSAATEPIPEPTSQAMSALAARLGIHLLNQCGAHTDELISYGNSMIIDPWGQVLQCANGTDEQVVLAELSGEQLDQVRQRLPALKHRRSELF